jgi:hypothetical protein
VYNVVNDVFPVTFKVVIALFATDNNVNGVLELKFNVPARALLSKLMYVKFGRSVIVTELNEALFFNEREVNPVTPIPLIDVNA